MDGTPDRGNSDLKSEEAGILNALQRSPLVGEDIVPPRPFDPGRKVDL